MTTPTRKAETYKSAADCPLGDAHGMASTHHNAADEWVCDFCGFPVEPKCADCLDTGVTLQTERPCSCGKQQPTVSLETILDRAFLVKDIKAHVALYSVPEGPRRKYTVCQLETAIRLAHEAGAKAADAMRETLRDHIINAYVEGAYQVHTHWQQDSDPDFGEAASDYAASVLTAPMEANHE